MSSNGNNKLVGQTFWDFLQRRGKYTPIILLVAFLLTWLITHLLALDGGQVEVCGLIKYKKGTSKKIEERIGYVPRSAIASEDGTEISPEVAVTVRKGGTCLRQSPSLGSPGPFLDEETEANVISLKNSWVKIKLKP